jgi:ABC-type Fe3+-hydroxamate transport system substrate-binding protein
VRRLAFLIATAAIAACTTNETTEVSLPQTDANVTGTFNLTSANGKELPYQAVVTTTEVWTLTADKIVIQPNNTWVDTTNYSVQSRLDQTITGRGSVTSGTYAIANGQINFTMTAGGSSTFVGAVTGSTLQVNFNGSRYVYLR